MEKSKNKNKKNQLFEIHIPENLTKHEIEFYAEQIPAGFPSPAEDFLEKRLDLNDYLIKNKSSTFLVKVHGDSMQNAGILDGDILVVDRSIEPRNGKIILGIINGEFTVKRLSISKNKTFLIPENDKFNPIEINDEVDFQVWGVVTFAIHKT